MKKNTPAKKGFAPFKENKNNKAKGDDFRPAKRSAAGGRPARKENDGEGFRARKSDDEGFRPRKNDGEGFRGRKSDDEGFRPRKNDGEGFRGRKSDDEGFRPRKNDGEGFRGRKSDDEGFRPRKTERRPAGKDENGNPRPAFKKKEHTEGEEATRRTRIKPAQKTANGRTPFKPKPGAKRDDSAFHGADRGDRKGKDERETPSGFNRKKFFDNTNERFAARQDRKQAARKARKDDTADSFSKARRSDATDSFSKTHKGDSTDSYRKNRKGDSADSYSKKGDKNESTVFIEGEMPLNKYIAHCGLCSRRKAVDYVKEGKISVNGTVITEPAFKVTRKDEVTILGKKMHIQKNLVYILLNKPKGYITTTDDPEGRKTVMELIQDATEEERVYPVGRLDRNTSGLLLLTNDGELAQKLSHPKHNIRKIYHVGLNKPLTKAHFEAILAGVELEDGIAHVDVLGYVDNADKTQIGIEIHSGKNRIVRRIFEHLEYEVEKLDRVTYAGLTKKNINRGHWRYLTEKEIILLKHFK
ncbi:pseudouridine synthase [Chitinophaga sp.]|uniref:pseudouridine synthase n=1 Tax=Chitinophaga sp. TaxID=1869181 RepID=UPI0031D933A1